MLSGDSGVEYIPPARAVDLGCCAEVALAEYHGRRLHRRRRRGLGEETKQMQAARLTGQDVAQAVGPIIRSTNGMVTGQKLVDAMRAALPLARKLVDSGAAGSDRNAVNNLELAARNLYVSNPSGGSPLPIDPRLTYGDSNRTKQAVRNTITKAVAASSGSLGVSAVKAQAIKEAIKDLTDPKSYADVIKKYAILIGLALVAVNLLPGLVARAARGK